MNKEVFKYLGKLRKELKGSDPALIQDALSDAESHLQTALEEALASTPRLTKTDALKTIIEKYGTPSEVACAYRAIESRVPPSLSISQKPDTRSFWAKFFGVLAETRAWGAFLYLFLALFTGIVFGGWAILGGFVSTISLLFIIGLPISVLFLLAIRGIALLEGQIVEALLGIRMPRRRVFLNKNMGWTARFKALVRDSYSWKSLLYAVLLFPLGLIYSFAFILFFVFSLGFITSPVLELVFHIPLDLFGDNVFTPVWLLPFISLSGFFLLPLTLHLAKFVGRIHGRFAKSMLVRK